MATTTYDINVRYKLEDKASKGAKKIGTELEKTARHGRSLLSTMKVVAAGAVVGFGLRAGKKWLIDYNSQLEDTRLTMTGLMKLNLGGTWAQNQKKANSLIDQFRQDAKASAGTMQDFAEFAQLITGPVTRAGMSMSDLRDITKGGVVAAKAFGIEAEVAARDIEQALAGTLGQKDRFARAILEPMGITTKAWNKMMKETPQLAARTLSQAFNQPALKEMADAYKGTWSGVTSTLKDNLQQTLGRVGLPLMKALVAEVQAMNRYFESPTGRQKLEKFIKDFSKGLMTGFGYVKDVVKLIVDNAGTLLSIAKAFVGFKLIQGAGGLLAGPFDMLASYSKRMGKASKSTLTFADKATMAANKMQSVGTILGVVYAGASLLAGAIDRGQERQLKRVSQRPQAFLSSAMEEQVGQRASMTVAYAKNAGLVDESGKVDIAAFASAMTGGKFTKKQIMSDVAVRDRMGGQFGGLGVQGFMANLQGFGADKRTGASYGALIAALEEDRKKKARDHENFVQKFGREIDAAGGLMSLYAKQKDQMFDITGEDRRFVGPTGEGEFSGEFAKPANRPTKKNGDVKVYINTIKVAADDPDRFAMRMIGAFRNANTKPVASRIRVPGGRPA